MTETSLKSPVLPVTFEKLLCNMAGVRKVLAIFAGFLVFCLGPTSSTTSELFSKNYAQIAQHFGFPFPPKLPNISFANVGSKQCREAVEKLNIHDLVRCEYFLV